MDPFLYPVAGAADIAGAAVQEIYTHRHGTDIKVFLLDHFDGGNNLV
jgi:hypothetical protein